MARKDLFVFAASLAVFALVPGAADAKLQGSGASVSFTAIGPAGMKIVGTTSDLVVKDDGQKIAIAVPLSGLKTGIDLRDKHMREKYLEVGQFPTAELEVARGSLALPADGSNGSGKAQGTIKIHGRSKPVTFQWSAKRAGASYDVSGSVQVNIKEFGIEVPSYMGVTVKPDVDVQVKFAAKDG